MNEHDREYVKSFFSDISAWSDACGSITVSYVAFRCGTKFELAKARVFFELWPRGLDKSFYQFENIQAGIFDLSELGVSPEAFIEELEKGHFNTPENSLSFVPENSGGYSAYYNPYENEGLVSGNRIGLLSIMGGHLHQQPRNTELDWELKSAEKPFDDVQDLLFELSLGTLNVSRTEVEFIALNCLRPELSEPFGTIESAQAKPAFVIGKKLDKYKASLGYRVIHQGNVIVRKRIDGSDLDWKDVKAGLRMSTEISLPEGAVMHCIGSYAGRPQVQWWLSDPSTAQNPLRAVYNTFDQGLEVLHDFLAKGPGKGNARDLETAIGWLLWMLGFRVANLGGTAKTQEAPDLIATTDQGHCLVIECTTGLLKADNKLPLLIQRTETLRESLKASGSHHLRMLSVIVTSKPRDEVIADIEQAEKLGVLVITKDEIQGMLDQSLVLPNAEKMYLEGVRPVNPPFS